MSVPEVEKYFSSTDARCVPTEYAKAQGAYASDSFPVDGKATCWWWLRSPGYYSCSAASVSISGSVFGLGLGYGATSGCDGVRPAMWVNLGS